MTSFLCRKSGASPEGMTPGWERPATTAGSAEQPVKGCGALLIAEGVQRQLQTILPQLPEKFCGLRDRQAHGLEFLHPLKDRAGAPSATTFPLVMTTKRSAWAASSI